MSVVRNDSDINVQTQEVRIDVRVQQPSIRVTLSDALALSATVQTPSADISARMQQSLINMSFNETLLLSTTESIAYYISDEPDNMLTLDNEGKLYVKPSNEWASTQW
ncbi:MAG TPA: hypothetical protein ENK70_03675 [Methylophaga sp.]|nr:hypothetical protein [Methylophaga sp.]